MSEFCGIYPMLLPFYTADDRVDATALTRQVELAVHCGCHGVAVMGLGTEVNKLSPDERRETVEAVARALAGRLPLSVTIGENSVRGQIEFARFAVEAGAAWFILQPPTVTDVSELELLRFFGRVADAVPLPIAVQNAAVYLGIQLSPEGLKSLNRQHPNIRLLKTEDDPEATAQLIGEVGDRFKIFVGRGGLDMVDELRAGAVGIIPGVETIDRTPQLYELYKAGQIDEATERYREILPLLVFLERSINHFVTTSREVFAQRLAIEPVRHRLAKELSPFARDTIVRHARRLGKLSEPARKISGGRL